MITRRQFLKLAGAAGIMPWGCAQLGMRPSDILLNDVHSGLNPTTVCEVISVRSSGDIQQAIARAARDRTAISVAGGCSRTYCDEFLLQARCALAAHVFSRTSYHGMHLFIVAHSYSTIDRFLVCFSFRHRQPFQLHNP